jgi:hypothetical protein
MVLRSFLLLFLSLRLIAFTNAQEFKAGAAFRVITPQKLLPISGGMGAPTLPIDKQGDLFVRVLVLENGRTRVALVGIDNLGWPAALGDKSRALIPGIPAENILIGATHTHSAPDAYAFPDQQGNTAADLDYLDWCVQQVADAVNEAVANLQPASLKTAVGEAKGKIAYNYYASDLYDPRCGVIQAIASSGSNKGKTIGTLVNYAAHPEILGTKRRLLSPDFCGPLYDRIESKAGGVAIFINGAQGGMVTADNRLEGGKEANDWQECVRIGELLADEALRIVSEAKVEENPVLTAFSKKVEFPVDSEMMRYVLKNSPLIGKTDRYVDASRISTQINLLQIGTAKVLTIPGEALPNIGYYLKRKMNSDKPFLFGLTNDAFGYILTKEDFDSFRRYEYISRTSLGEQTGEILVNESLKLIQESADPVR